MFPDFHGVLGEVEGALGNYDEAIVHYQRALESAFDPGYVIAIGDLYSRIGDTAAADAQYAAAGEFFGDLDAGGLVVYGRTSALFYADNGIEAARSVELAENDLAARQDVHAYDTLAWALYRGGRADEAAPHVAQALRLGTQDASLFFHAGLIARDTGDKAEARRLLTQAIDLNPRFSVLFEDEAARALEELGGPLSADAAD